ncbi:MAG: hypothetical protein U0075_01640, partial [Thermomicrobiales bacterium]
MGFRATVYRAMVISPGDVPAERDLVEQAIIEWNDEHSEARGIVFLPTRWERSSPRQGATGQDILNEDLVDISDLGIALFWERLGSKTRNSESGAVEEVERFASSRKLHCVLFKTPSDSPPDPEQFQALLAFKKRVHAHEGPLIGLTKPFADGAQLQSIVKRYLTDSLSRLPHVTGDAGLTLDQQDLLTAIANQAFSTDNVFVNTSEIRDETTERFSGGRLQAALDELSRQELVKVLHDLGDLGFALEITEPGILQSVPNLGQIERRIRDAVCAQWKTTSREIADRLKLPELLVIAVTRGLQEQGLVNMLRLSDTAEIHRPTSELCQWDRVRPRKACLVLGPHFPSRDSHGEQAIEVDILNGGEFDAHEVRVFWDTGRGFPSPENYAPLYGVIPARTNGSLGSGHASFRVPYPERSPNDEPIQAQQREVHLKLTFRDGSEEP